MKKIYLILICAFWIIGVNAQAPANDVCSGAIVIPPTGPFPYLTGATSNVDATDTDDPVSSCQGNSHKALWYSFTPASTGDYYISSCQSDAPLSTISDNILAIYTSATGCTGPFTQISCDDDGCTTLNLQGVISNINLTGGTTYYILVSSYNTSVGDVQLNIKQAAPPPPPPANDDCSGAIELTVNADLNCGVTTLASTVGATASAGETTPTCAATGVDDDIWYKFTATATTHVISLTTDSGSTDRAMQIYSGACGSLVTVVCSDPENLTATGLTIGESYTLRVYTYTNSTTARSKFLICIGTLPPPPANDNAAGALGLTVNADYLCAVSTSGTTFSATQSPDAAPTCSAAGINDDVWYYFTATAAAHRISLTGTSNTMAAALYTGTPGSLTFLTGACASTTLNATSLIIGTTYYVRAYTTSSVTTTGSNFNICVGTPPPPPPPPANDDCSGAIALTVNADLSCSVTTLASTESATASVGGLAPSCGSAGGPDDDIWFKFIATATSHIISLTSDSGSTDRVMELYSGVCGSLISVVCSDPESVTASGLNVGETYTLRVYTYSSSTTTRSKFRVCVGTPPPMTYISSTTTQSSSASVTAGTVNQQIVRLQVIVNGTLNPVLNMSQIDINTGASTNPAVDIDSVKIYYTGTSTTFTTATQFGAAVANPNGAVSFTGSQNLIASGTSNTSNYFWVVYNIACGATATNLVDAQVTGFNIGTAQTPTVTDPAGTRAIIAATSTATTSQPSTAAIIGGSANNQILRVALVSCSGSTVSQLNFNTLGSTNAATDISAARVFYTTSTTFATTTQFGADVVAPNGAFSVNGSQILTTGTGYFWLVYDVPASATDANVVDAANESAVVGGNTLIPATPNPTGTRTIIAPLVNDNAPGAIEITVNAGCPGTLFTLVNASQSTNEPTGSCSSLSGYATVWYKFVAPASGAVKISTDQGAGNTLTDSRVALFSATDVNDYSTFTILGCDEDAGSVLGSGYMSVFYTTNLVAGNTYYVQVDKYSSTTTSGTFCLTIDELNATMLSSTASCSSIQSPLGSIATYSGWTSLVDASSNLVAVVRNVAGGSVGSYTGAHNINTAAVRTATYGTPYLDRNYLINNSTATNVEVQFFFLASELAALNAVDGTTLSTLGVSRQAGTACRADFSVANGIPEVLPQTGNGTSTDGLLNWVTVNTPSFSNFYLHKATEVLPITLEYFKGFKQNKTKNQLSWKVDCTNAANNTIILERSADQQNFTAIHRITTLATEACNQPYSFSDDQAISGMNYYRLKLIDEDGSFKYSNVVALFNGSQAFELISLAPNPVKNITNLKIASDKAVVMNLTITDIAGKKVSTQKVQLVTGQNVIALDFSKLAAGTYQITGVTAEATLQTIRFVKQ